MTNIYLRLDENGGHAKMNNTVHDSDYVYLLGYSFFDTSLNVRNFSVTTSTGTPIAIPDGNYDINSFAGALVTAGLTITIQTAQGSIIITEDVTPQNEDTNNLLNGEGVGTALGIDYDTGLLALDHSRIFYIDIDGLSSDAVTSSIAHSYVIINNRGGTPFDNVANSNFNNPQYARNIDNMIGDPRVTIRDQRGAELRIGPQYPAYLHLYACKGPSTYSVNALNSRIH